MAENKYSMDNVILEVEKQFKRLEEGLRSGDIPVPQVGGEANTYSSLGSGAPVIGTKSGVDFPFKSFTAGAFIAITDNGNELEVSLSGVPGVEQISMTDLSDADMSGVTDGQVPAFVAVDGEFKPFSIGSHPDVAANTAARHSHANKPVLDKIDEPSPPQDGWPLAWSTADGKYQAQDVPTAAEIKTRYESNPDTNVLTNALLSDLNNNTLHRDGSVTGHSDVGGLAPNDGEALIWVGANSQYEPQPLPIGETNDAVNVGGGFSIFKQKTGVTLEFRKVSSVTGIIEIVEATDTVDFNVDTAALNAAIAIPSTQITDKGDPNGIAPLDPSGIIPVGYLPDLPLGFIEIRGNWNADTNTPELTSGIGEQGFWYRVAVAGSTDLDGITDWKEDDIAWFDGISWRKIDNTSTVESVNGQTGAVSLDTDDVAEGAGNLYYTEPRVSANPDVAANTAARHSHANKSTLDAITSEGSGQVITATERSDLGAAKTHADGDLSGHSDVDYSTAPIQGHVMFRDGMGNWIPAFIPSESISDKGVADGIAPLDSNGVIPIQHIPDSVKTGLKFKGTWDANANNPNLQAANPGEGDFYIVSVDGSTDLDGITDWKVGDWVVYVNGGWEKVDNSDRVSSVNGQAGAVVLDTDDISEGASNLYYTEPRVSANADVAANTAARHTHANKPVLDKLAEPVAPNEGDSLTYDADLSQYVPQPGMRTKLVRVARGTNLPGFSGGEITGITSPYTIDGITLQDGDRVLVFAQSNSEENGIYVYDLTNEKLVRATDFDEDDEILRGQEVLTEEGLEYGAGLFVSLSDRPVVNTDPIDFLKVADVRAKVSSDDTTPGLLSQKIVGSADIQVQVIDPGANEKLQIDLIPPAGATDFTGLSDTPTDYAGDSGKIVVVKATEDGLEFIDLPQETFIGLPDTPGAYVADKFVAVNGAGDALVFVDAPAGDFAGLTDTPAGYAAGDAGKLVAVNGTEDGLEFIDAPSGSFSGLTDTPVDYSGAGGQFVAVKVDETGLEFIDGGAGDGFIANTHTIANSATQVLGSTAGIYEVWITGEERKYCTVAFDGTGADVIALTPSATATYGDSAGANDVNIYVDTGNLTAENLTGASIDLKVRRMP